MRGLPLDPMTPGVNTTKARLARSPPLMRQLELAYRHPALYGDDRARLDNPEPGPA